MFKHMDFTEFDPDKTDDNEGRKIDQETANKHYTGPSRVLEHMYEYELLVPGFETDKKKSTILKKIEIAVTSGLVPESHLDAIFHMAVGVLWIKFTPCHDAAMMVLQ